MRYGLTLPIFDELADPRLLAELAARADAAGWDGVFVWDHVLYREPVRAATDPWTALAAMALATSRVRIGPMVTPLARRRPQVVARKVAALDHLSGGRFVLGTGLGLDGSGGEFARFGEPADVRVRAAAYDEALGLVRGLLSGRRVDHVGPTFTADGVRFLPTPLQAEVPIWCAARWPHRRPLVRAARHQGVALIDLGGPADVAEARTVLGELRADDLDGFEVVVQRPAGDDHRPWAAAGATWLLTAFDPFSVTADDVRRAIDARPTD